MKRTAIIFQLQPVYSVPLNDANLVLRGIIPIQGVQPGAVLPPEIIEPSPQDDLTWGIGDTTLQAFYAPTPGESGIAIGYGLQASLPTRTDDALTGAGWGAGPAFVVFGQTGDLSWGGVLGHMWGEDNFSVTIVQPILTYGLGEGWYFGYNNAFPTTGMLTAVTKPGPFRLVLRSGRRRSLTRQAEPPWT